MGNELEQVELEIARVKLAREQLALQDELKKRNRQDRVADISQNLIDTTRDVTREIARPKKGAFNWMVWIPAAFGLFLLIAGGPGDQGMGGAALLLAIGIFLYRVFRR